MNKTLKLAFIASIVVNVLLAGVLLGQLPRRFDKSSSRQQRIEATLQKLPESVRARFRATLEQSAPIREQIRAARTEAIQILMAEPFDETAYDRQVKKIAELRGQLGSRFAAVVRESAKELPSEQRKIMATALQRPSNASR